MQLSIIVVNFNTKELLINCLNSIYRNTSGIEFEVIVVDNASSDESVDALSKKYPQVRVIANKENTGFATANNQGIKIARGKYVLLLNSDTIVLGDCLRKVCDFMEQASNAGVVGCKTLNTDRTLQYSCYHDPNFLTELLFFTKGIIKGFWDPFTHYKYMKYWDHNATREVDCVSGCFLGIRKTVFDKIGLLDENFFMYYEDSEFCRRVKKETNFKVFYYPEAEIIHHKGMSINMDNFDTLQHCYQSARYYFRKCYGKMIEVFFNFSCKFVWRLEILVFSFLKGNKKFTRKLCMLKEYMSKS